MVAKAAQLEAELKFLVELKFLSHFLNVSVK